MLENQYPNVYLAGAPKSGTSSLAEALAQHPEVALSRFKEPQYFATNFRRRIIDTEEEYLAQFRHRPNAKARIDATATYMYSGEAIKNISHLAAGARYIVILRDPMGMVPSWHAEMLLDLSENNKSFHDAWAATASRRLGQNVPSRCPFPPYLYYDSVAKYAEQLLAMLQHVERKQVHIVLFEDMLADSQRTLQGICSFLELAPPPNIDLKVVNRRQEWRGQLLARVVRTQTMQRLKRRWLGVGRFSRLAPLFFREQQRPKLTEELRAEIRRAYADDVNMLKDMLKRPLEGWLA